jgi:hypothetical protein
VAGVVGDLMKRTPLTVAHQGEHIAGLTVEAFAVSLGVKCFAIARAVNDRRHPAKQVHQITSEKEKARPDA